MRKPPKPVYPVAKPFRPAAARVGTEEELVQLCLGFLPAKLVLAAAETGLFDALEGAPRAADAVAARAGTEPRATRIALDALAGMALLRKRGGRYALAPLARDCLTRSGRRSKASALALWSASWERAGELPARLRGERPTARRRSFAWREDEEMNRAFIRAMYEGGWWIAQGVAGALDLRGARRMLDLGGGPGHYAIALLARNPGLRATIVDLPLTLKVAREAAERHGLLGRMDFVPCDLYKSRRLPLEPEAYDLALLSNVVHMESAEANRGLLRRIVPALRPGGRAVIHEFLLEEDRARPARSAMFSVQMLAMTERGELYPYSEMASWLREAGLRPRLLAKEPFLTEGRRPGKPR